MMQRAVSVFALSSLALSCYAGNDRASSAGPHQTRDAGLEYESGLMDAAATTPSDIPCEVANLLATRCIHCHDGTTESQSETPLVDYASLLATSDEDPSRKVAERALLRMEDSSDPMPPEAPFATSDEIAAFRAWVDSGFPSGSCEVQDVDAGPSEYDTPLQCSSGTYWTRGNEESSRMHPGKACIRCHTEEREGPRYSIAGTVFRTAHEPDDCNGTEDVLVIIQDANDRELRLTTNSAGNFYSRESIAFPYFASVSYRGEERSMLHEQDDGDCNTCHTEDGDERAPGRIMLP